MEPTETPTTAIAVIQELTAVEAGLADLVEAYGGKTYAVETTAGMEEAKKARAAIRAPRYEVDKIVTAKKAEARQAVKNIEAEGDRITAALLAIEKPIHAQIEAELERKSAEKAEKERVAAELLKKLNSMIDAIVRLPLQCVGKTSTEIQEFHAAISAREIGAEFTGEIRDRAEQAKANALSDITNMLKTAVATEKELREKEIRDKISALDQNGAGLSIRGINTMIDSLSRELTAEEYGEFLTKAIEVRDASLNRMNALRETMRIDGINKKIAEMRELVSRAEYMSIDDLMDQSRDLAEQEFTAEEFQEFLVGAIQAKEDTIGVLRAACDRKIQEAKKRIKDEEKLAEEKLKLEKEREEFEAKQEKALVEEKRVVTLKNRINNLKTIADKIPLMSIDIINYNINDLNNDYICEEEMQEFWQEYQDTRKKIISILNEALAEKRAEAELMRKQEEEKAEAEKAKKLADAKCASLEDALMSIYRIAQNKEVHPVDALEEIALIAEANLGGTK